VGIVCALPPEINAIRTADTHFGGPAQSTRFAISDRHRARDLGCDDINRSEIHKLCQKVCNGSEGTYQ